MTHEEKMWEALRAACKWFECGSSTLPTWYGDAKAALAAAPQPPRVTEEEKKHNLNPEQLRTLRTLDVDAALKAIADKGFIPGARDDVLAGLHRVRLQCKRYFTVAEIAESKSWLCDHGYSHDL